MPLTLYGYILRDLLKLLALSTAALVVLMSVGFVIKPISEGTLGALQLLKLLFYVMPGMLSYALPVAAAFSATMVFFRLSTDNEITACAMSGISYRSLLMPTVLLGVALTLTMFFLTNWVIPGFWQKVAQVAQQDAARWLVEQVRRREVVKLENRFVLYADRAEMRDLPTPDPGAPGQDWPFQRIVLEHAAVGKINAATGELEADYTGQLAVADLYRIGGRTYAVVKLTNATVKDPETGILVSVAEQGFPAQEIPSLFQTKPQFLSLARLRRMSEQPDTNPDVRQFADRLREAIAVQQAVERMQAELSAGPDADSGGAGVLELTGPQDEDYQVIAPQVRREDDRLMLEASGDQAVVVRIGQGLAVRQRLEAQSARLEVAAGEPGDEPRANLRLNQVRVIDPRLPTPSEVKTVYLTLLRLKHTLVTPLQAQSSSELLQLAADSVRPQTPGASDQQPVMRAAERLDREIHDLRRNIVWAVNERGAMAVCAMLVMALGAVMSMWLRQQVPLVIFFWCFLPAVLAIFMVSGARNMIKADALGLGEWFNAMMIWSGNIMLLGVIAAVYSKLARH